MLRRIFLFFSLIMFLATTSCIKETYDMNKLPEKTHFSPTIAISAINGNVTFSDLDLDLNIRINGLEILDTVDNFLKMEGLARDNPVKPENLEKLSIEVAAKNGFPLKVSLQMSLYNSGTQTIKSQIKAKDILEAAPVDSKGKVKGVAETATRIEFTREFLSSIPMSDKIIFQFTFNTPNNGTDYVSIYSDYKIYFNVALVMKPDFDLN